MRVAVIAIAALTLASRVAAECANACSGHGVCRDSDQCDCYPNFNGADCSERICPYGLAFVDNPRGDLNHNAVRQKDTSGNLVTIYTFSNGDTISTDSPVNVQSWETYNPAAQANEAHFYTECSNKGLCDRSTGLCSCFDGYTGSSCQRTTCPNDCSGHGICRTVDEIAAGNLPTAAAVDSNIFASANFGGLNKREINNKAAQVTYSGVTTSTLYRLWDQDMAQACVCDTGYSGADCSRRECPRGDDPLTHRVAECPAQAFTGAYNTIYGGALGPCLDEVQTLTLTNGNADVGAADWFRLLFRDWTGKIWSTDDFLVATPASSGACTANADLPVAVDAAAVAAAVKNALTSIPNNIINAATVSASEAGNTFTIVVTFTTTRGNLNPLSIVNSKNQQLSLPVCFTGDKVVNFDTTAVAEVNGNKEASTCSNRGVCDYDTGLCSCFNSYWGGDCSLQLGIRPRAPVSYCPAGYYGLGEVCTRCPSSGSWSAVNSLTVDACQCDASVQAVLVNGLYTCTSCAADYYGFTAGYPATCTPCPAGLHVNAGYGLVAADCV